jgi:hypothetical protein
MVRSLFCQKKYFLMIYFLDGDRPISQPINESNYFCLLNLPRCYAAVGQGAWKGLTIFRPSMAEYPKSSA